MTAFDGSVTVPLIAPVVLFCASISPGINKAIIATTANSLLTVVNRISCPPWKSSEPKNSDPSALAIPWEQSRDPMSCKPVETSRVCESWDFKNLLLTSPVYRGLPS
jgi:hypothetical protein